ncbi:hypothetical protein BDN72DRAFT_900653, partial [Pluteus cervinus]
MLVTPSNPILTQTFDTSDIAFTEIDKEITVLKQQIRALHTFRNTFTPIYRLPAEVLARIFSFTRYARAHRVYTRKPMTPSWVVVTHVSQHWSNVALTSPNLWSHLSSSYPTPIVDLWLQRSKCTPLSVDHKNFSAKNAQLVSESLLRTRELSVELGADSWKALENSLSSPAPLLESLSVSISADLQLSSLIEPVDCQFSAGLFAGIAPQLRGLKLNRCSVGIKSSLFTDLTVLRLRQPPQKFSMMEILAVVSRFPRLTFLTLSHTLRPDADPVPPAFDIISLSSLKSLTIEGRSFVQDLDLLSHFSYPSNSKLWFNSDTTTGDALSVLSDFLK